MATVTSDRLDFDTAMIKGMRQIESGKDSLYGLFTVIGINVGMRKSDLITITAEDINKGFWFRNEGEKKTGKKRKVTFNQNVINAYKAYVKRNGKQSGSLFVTRNGKEIMQSTLNGKLKSIFVSEVSKGYEISTHSLRKTFAWRYYSKSNDKAHALTMLMEVLNHSNLSITKRYLGLTAMEVEDVYMNL